MGLSCHVHVYALPVGTVLYLQIQLTSTCTIICNIIQNVECCLGNLKYIYAPIHFLFCHMWLSSSKILYVLPLLLIVRISTFSGILLVVMVIPCITIATSTCWACRRGMSKTVTVVTVDRFSVKKTRSPYLSCDISWILNYLAM